MTSVDVNGHAGDMAQFVDSPGNDTFYAYADFNKSGKPLAGMYGGSDPGYSNSASGFGTNIAYAINGGNDSATFFDSPGNDTFYAYDADMNNNGQPLAGMYGSYGSGFSNVASGFATNTAYSINGGSDTAAFFDSAGNDTFDAYANYNHTGKPMAYMSGSGYSGGYFNSAVGFAANAAYSTNGGSDTAVFYDAAGPDYFYANTNYGSSDEPFASMSGAGYSNSASGFGASVAYATSGNDTAQLVGSSGTNTLYTNPVIAQLSGNNSTAKVSGFRTVNAVGAAGGVNIKGVGPVNYKLTYIGSWVSGS
jgi:hypothetical protein